MNKDLTPPNWGDYDSNMVLNVGDAKYYFENFTSLVNQNTKTNKLAIDNLDGRVAKIEHQIPVGPGGKGAYLDLGGTPERYPTAEEMVEGGNETSFVVVARTDGIYFYNPVTKRLIKPKKGGGNIAVHGQLPMIYDKSHQLQHEGRASISGIYTAKCSDVGLRSWSSAVMCKILIVVTEKEEYQTAMHPDGIATRVFKDGEVTSNWNLFTGGSGGGVSSFVSLTDTPNTYHPGKLLGYNLSGTALVPVDPINNFKAMTDTPNSYTGHGRKAVVVTSDESGLEFASMPNLSPLQTEINTLHNSVVRIEGEQGIQNRDITALQERVAQLEGLINTLTNKE